MRNYQLRGMTAAGPQVDEDMTFEEAMYQGSRIRSEPYDPRVHVTHRPANRERPPRES